MSCTPVSPNGPTRSRPACPLGASSSHGVALWSLGMVLARFVCPDRCQCVLAPWLGRKSIPCANSCVSSATKPRPNADRTLCSPCGNLFCALLAWVVSLWAGHALALALDATTLAPAYRLGAQRGSTGCASPSSGSSCPATANMPGGGVLRLLRQVYRAGPTVVDGPRAGRSWLYARWLFRRINSAGLASFLRINTGGTFRHRQRAWGAAADLVPEPGTAWQGTGIAFKGRHRQLHCTLPGALGGGLQGSVV